LPIFPAVTCRERLVRCLAELGEFVEGSALGEEGMRMAEELDHPLSLTQMCVGLGLLRIRQGDLTAAIPILERGLDLGRRWSISLYAATLAAAVGWAYALTGRVAEGLRLLHEGVEEAASKRAILGHAVRLAWLAEGHLVGGEHERAREVAQQALDLTRRYKEKGQEAWTLHLLGEIARRRDPVDVENAEHLYRQAMTIAEALGMRPAQAHCRLGLGEMHARAGNHRAAGDHFSAASTLFGDMGVVSLQKRGAGISEPPR
jgi:tetratricopeptide (TPR) repeat protein